jgi:NAD(P)-dependent dehydrogenase (short-subunit alcohol dehydrogenase family)
MEMARKPRLEFAGAIYHVLSRGNYRKELFDDEQRHAVRQDTFSGLCEVQLTLPLMPSGGSIVINGSMVSIKGVPAFGVYAATKAALRSRC